MLLTEYDEEQTMQLFKEEGFEEGFREGFEEGFREGFEESQDQYAHLADILLSLGREEDLKRCKSDRDFRKQMFQEFQIA